MMMIPSECVGVFLCTYLKWVFFPSLLVLVRSHTTIPMAAAHGIFHTYERRCWLPLLFSCSFALVVRFSSFFLCSILRQPTTTTALCFTGEKSTEMWQKAEQKKRWQVVGKRQKAKRPKEREVEGKRAERDVFHFSHLCSFESGARCVTKEADARWAHAHVDQIVVSSTTQP